MRPTLVAFAYFLRRYVEKKGASPSCLPMMEKANLLIEAYRGLDAVGRKLHDARLVDDGARWPCSRSS